MPKEGEEDTLTHALLYQRRGWSVLPLQPHDKRPDLHEWKSLQEAPPPEDQLREWFANSDRNIGIVTGKVSGLTVVDLDRPEAFPFLFGVSIDELAEKTPVVFTGRREAPSWAPKLNRGIHIYLKGVSKPFKIIRQSPEDPKAPPKVLVEVKSEGGYVVAPPSLHPSNLHYTWVKPPEGIIQVKKLREFLRPWLVAESLLPWYQEGTRHDLLKGVAAYLRKNRGWSQESTEKVLARVGMVLGLPAGDITTRVQETYRKDLEEISIHGFLKHVWGDASEKSIQELQERLDSVLNQIDNNPGGPQVTVHGDFFNEQGTLVPGRVATVLMKEDVYRTVEETDEILVYRKGMYVNAEPYAKGKIQQFLGQEYASTYRANEILNHIRRSTYTPLYAFDPDPDVLNLLTGLLNVETNQLMPHSPDYLSRVQLDIIYDPSVDCPRFKEFLKEVLPPVQHDTMQEAWGYCLYKAAPFHVANLLIGSGRNGKSTFLKVLREVLGKENVADIALQDLDETRFATAELEAKLANIFWDLPGGRIRSAGKFKALVAGDPVTAERKYGQLFRFQSYAVHFYSANRLPPTEDQTDAFFARTANLFSFPYRFEGQAARNQKVLVDELLKERSGILNWMLDGLKRLLKQNGFTGTPTIEKSREDYIRASDPIQYFVETCIAQDAEAEPISKDDLYSIFASFCQKEGLVPPGKGELTKDLPRHAPSALLKQPRVGGRRVRMWYGIRYIKEEEEPSQTKLEETEALAKGKPVPPKPKPANNEEIEGWTQRAMQMMRTDPKKPFKFLVEDLRKEFEIPFSEAQSAALEAERRLKEGDNNDE